MQSENKLSEETLYTNGSFSRKVLWFSGWDQMLAREYIKNGATVKFINGLSGNEIEVTVEEIKPIAIFEVI
jgi:hypothetical protein